MQINITSNKYIMIANRLLYDRVLYDRVFFMEENIPNRLNGI